jgi:uncharacterized protein (TIGR00369 family)
VSIWQLPPNLEAISLVSKDTLSEKMGIEFIEAGDDYLKARMPVDERTHQPMGLLHGGASAALAETVGSVAGLFTIDPSRQYVVGLALNVNHLRSVREGWVSGLARPHHLGRTTQVWGIEIRDAEDRLVSIVQLTLAVRSYAEGQEPTIPAEFFESGNSK